MDDPANQTSKSPNNGPTRTKEVIDPIVDDLAEVWQWMRDATAEINRLKNRIIALETAPQVTWPTTPYVGLGLPSLPTSVGNYNLAVATGPAYSWTLAPAIEFNERTICEAGGSVTIFNAEQA